MRHLVIGASGLVGRHLYRLLKKNGEMVWGTYYRSPEPNLLYMDLVDFLKTRRTIMDIKPDVIYIAGAYTNVNACETDQGSYLVNVQGVKHVLDSAKQQERRPIVVFFSSNYVFPGTAGPYTEIDTVDPLNEYGRQKVYAEHCVLQYGPSLIVRTSWVYGVEPQAKNFVYQVVRALQMKQPFPVADDQLGTPTYALELAEYVLTVVKCGTVGIVHLAGISMPRMAFANEIAREWRLDMKLLTPIPTANMRCNARRPLNGSLESRGAPVLRPPTYHLAEMHEEMENTGFVREGFSR